MRRTPVPSLLTGVAVALALLPAAARAQLPGPAAEPTTGVVTGATGPTGPAVDPAPPSGPEPRRRTVTSQLLALRDAGYLAPEAAARARAQYVAARSARKRLGGRRRAELSAVLANLEAVAGRGELSSSRVPLAFLTLERNRQWWTTRALLGAGARVGFPGSELVWQSYPGQGIQVQWLGTWGQVNALLKLKRSDARLRALVDEALGLAGARAGGIAFESWFTFDGGRPPWVSGLSTGTALQALARAGVRLGEPRYLDAARAALGIFRTKPPTGIRVVTAAGADYLQYSFAPRLRIVNGFVQALNGLHDLGELADDDGVRALFDAGDAQLRAELPGADTGAWSRYALGGNESDLGYHTLLRDFLKGLCQRTALPLYCQTADAFTADLTRPPVVRLLAARGRKGRAARVPFTVDKVSTVSLVADRRGKLVFARTLRLARGRHVLELPKLRSGADLELRLRAVDLAGNAAEALGTLPVRG